MKDYWDAFPKLRSALFADNGTPYVEPQVEDLAQAIRDHKQVQDFVGKFSDAFSDFSTWLSKELIDQKMTLYVPKQEALIGANIFERVESVPLIDKYHAYQLLDDSWQEIAIDLEILQTEGEQAARVVEPNLVIKTRKGKKGEVQEGWKGRIMPFELVQETYLKEELEALRCKEIRLSEVGASMGEALESLSEEDKAGDTVNDAGDKWVNAAVTKEAKELAKEGPHDSESYEAKIVQVAQWIAEEKSLKAAIKKEADALHLKTKKTIEELSDAQVEELLNLKWIAPLNESLYRLPEKQIDYFADKLEALVEKYRVTYAENSRSIRKAESELGGMLDELEGNEFDLKGISELRNLLTEK